ncbi:MAG TPA: PRC-barrel domain-containing protein [Lacipirellulaceae bacterium]|nr:PRC-barrel domain-containing protein [Lacipirellulaceae bacterium]
MNLKVIVAATAMPVLATVAYAQTAPTTPSTTPSATETPSTTAPSATTAGTAPVWYSHQQGEWRSTQLVGSKVKNNAGDTIGDINDIILSNDGSAAAAVIGVGGFLGMGEHQVAVQFKSLKISRDSNGNDVVMLDTTKDALKNAPQWTWQSS